jgi:PAS domain S-box-containing protein
MTKTAVTAKTGFGRRAWVFAVGLVVIQAALLAWNLEHEYRHTLDTEYARLADAARIADESFGGSLRAIDLLLRDVAAELDRRGSADPVTVTDYMTTRARALPEVRTVIATNVDGIITASTRPDLLSRDIHTRAYYVRAHDSNTPNQTLFSSLMVAKPTNADVIFATRKIMTPDGHWAGIVTATLEIKMFHALLASIFPADSGNVIVLVGKDDHIISRQPDPEKFVGFDLSQAGYLKDHWAEGRTLSFHWITTLTEGVDKMAAVRTVGDGSFVMIVTKPVQQVLAPWYAQVINQAIAFIALSFAVFSLTWLAIRHHGREAQANALAILAEDARQVSDERLALATTGARIGIWDYDLITGFCVYDTQMMRLYGLDGDGGLVTIESWQSSVHPEDRQHATEDVLAAVQGVRPLDTEFRIVRPDKTIVHIKSMAQVYRGDDGQPTRMVGINIDVTASKQSEQDLKEAKDRAEASAQALVKSERFTRAVADNLPGMVGYWDTDIRCRFANRHYLDWFGRTSDQMLGVGLRELQGDDLFSINEPFIRGALRGEYQNFERTLVKEDGSIGYTWAQYIPDRDDYGNVRGFFVLVTDITTIKQTELRLKETNEQLMIARDKADAANQAKSAFLAMMSHEIRTPITGVLGMADLLRQTPLTQEQANYLDTLATSTNTLLTILNDVLDISKIEAGKVVFETIKFSIHDSILDTIALFNSTATAKSLTLTHSFDETLPRLVIGDPARFKQLLFNLTSNALKFTEYGGVHLRVSVKSREADFWVVRIEVEDTGVGIAADQLPLLFQPFTQLGSSTARRFGGTGLGLVITQRLIEMMGGTIGVDSQPGTGTRFWFTLPFQSAPGDATPRPGKTSPTETMTVLRPLRILLAEDNRINQMLVSTMLRKAGHTVDVVDNGLLAVAAVTHQTFDVVLMDMQMPEMDGEQATRAIRAFPSAQSRIPIVALTADAMPEHCARYLAAGVNDLVAKPIDWDALLASLIAHVGAEVPANRSVEVVNCIAPNGPSF